MRRLFLVLFVSLAALPMLAQPAVDWVQLGLGPNLDDATSIVVAPNGEVRVAGTYSDSISFDKGKIQAYGNYDVFMTRFAANGGVMIANTFGGLDVDECNSISLDNKGNVYVCGAFSDQMLIGDTTLETINLASVDIFVAKFDRMGAFLWAKVFGSTNFDETSPYVAADSTGNVYLAGSFGRTAEFDKMKITADGKADMFLCKLNSSGAVQWVKKIGGIENDRATGLCINKDGSRINVVGTFESAVLFDARIVESFNNKADFFVVSYDNTGVIKWWHRMGTPGIDRGIACAMDRKDNLVITGAFAGAMSYVDNSPPTNSNGNLFTDIFLAKLDAVGGFTWTKKFGGINEDFAFSVATDRNNNIFVGGYYENSTVFGENVIAGEGGREAVLFKVNEVGDYDWVVQATGPYDDEIHGVVIDENSNPIVCGVFDTRVTIGSTVYTGQRFSDVFVARFKCGPNTLLIPAITRLDICQGADTLLRVRDGYPGYQWYDNNNVVTGATRSRFSLEKLTSGVHKIKVQVTGFDQCVGFSVEVTVAVADGMAKPLITQVGPNLKVSIDNAVTYEWTREGKPTSKSGTQTIASEGTGLYRVRVTDSSGCTRWSDGIVIGTTDISTDFNTNAVSLRPNPAFETLTLNIGGESVVRIVDMIGNTMYMEQASGSITMNLQQFAPGAYMVVVLRGSEMIRLSFIKQ